MFSLLARFGSSLALPISQSNAAPSPPVDPWACLPEIFQNSRFSDDPRSPIDFRRHLVRLRAEIIDRVFSEKTGLFGSWDVQNDNVKLLAAESARLDWRKCEHDMPRPKTKPKRPYCWQKRVG
jgi:hypothetical protein